MSCGKEEDKWQQRRADSAGTAFRPRVWLQFQGKSGRRYWVQDVTDEHREDVVHYMTHNFILDEPLDKYSKYPADDAYKAEMAEYWRETLDQRLGLVCLTEDVGTDGQTTTVVAGMNCTCRKYKGQPDEDDATLTPRSREFNAVLSFMTSQRDAFDTFGISEYLGALGLYVVPQYRGVGVGLHLIKAREYLCKVYGFKASLTVFTSAASQKLAEKCGFEDFFCTSYEDLAKLGKEFDFPGISENTERIRFMYKLYD